MVRWFCCVFLLGHGAVLEQWSKMGLRLTGKCRGHDGKNGVLSNMLIGGTMLLSPRWISFLWNYVLGMSYQEALPYHRRLGNVVLLTLSLHFLYAVRKKGWGDIMEKSANVYGIISFGLYCGIFVTSFWFVRRLWWEVFQYVHVPLVVCFIAFGIMHTSGIEERQSGVPFFTFLIYCVLPGIILFALDRIGRIVMIAWNRSKVMEAHPIGKTHARLLLSVERHPMRIRPDQIVFIAVPSAAPVVSLCWHPFSVASDPRNSGRIGLVAKSYGPNFRAWTGYLRELVERKETFPVFMEGPYGTGNAHMVWQDLDAIVFTCGGVGGTPMIPFLYDIASGNGGERYSRLKKVYVLWVGRNNCDQLWNQFASHGDNLWDLLAEQPDKFDVRFFDTGSNADPICSYVAQRLFRKRPNYDDIADSICEQWSVAQRKSSSMYARIGVITCGPPELMEASVRAFDKWWLRWRQGIVIDIHRETFEM